MDLVLLTALGVGGATVIGALIGFLFKNASHKFSDMIQSFAAGIMLAAAVFGLIVPSLEYGGKFGLLVTIAGIFVGALFLNVIDRVVPHLHRIVGSDIESHGHNANLSLVCRFIRILNSRHPAVPARLSADGAQISAEVYRVAVEAS